MATPLANVDNSHNAAPITSSKVGPVQGCGGPPTSPEALKQDGVFQMASKGGAPYVSHRRGREYRLAGGKRTRRRSSKRRHHSRRRHAKKKTHRRRRHHRGGQMIDPILRDSVTSGTEPVTSDTNTAALASINHDDLMMGGRKSHRRRRHHKKSRKHTRKHRRRGSRRMKGGDGVYAAALTPSYSAPGELDSSALASPPPIVRTNNCLDTYKHLGDKPPYNEEWKGIN